MPRTLRVCMWVILGLSVAVCLYGFCQNPNALESYWRKSQEHTNLATMVGLIFLTLLVLGWRFPAVAVPAIVGLALTFLVSATGLASPVIVLVILISGYALGDLIFHRWFPGGKGDGVDRLLFVMVGMGVQFTLIGYTAGWKVHYRFTYLLLLLLPILLNYRPLKAITWQSLVSQQRWWLTGKELLSLGLLFSVLAIHLVNSCRMETGYDALSHHLPIFHTLASAHYWPFDFNSHIWATMPAGGDWSYSLAYLFSGESGAHLLCFTFLVFAVALGVQISRRWVSRSVAYILGAIFASIPFFHQTTSSLFIDNVLMAFLFGGVIIGLRFVETFNRGHLLLALSLCGISISIKMTAGLFVGPCVLLLFWLAFKRKERLDWVGWFGGILLLALLGCYPYIRAYWLTGNPVYPFFNAVFQSPFYPADVSFDQPLYKEPLSLTTLYDLTFHTGRYLETEPGVFGFQFLLFLPMAILTTIWKRCRFAGFAMILVFIFIGLLFRFQSYLRYAMPAMPVFALLIARGFGSLREIDRRLHGICLCLGLGALGLNVWMFPAASCVCRDFPVMKLLRGDRSLGLKCIPERRIVPYLNTKYGRDTVVCFASRPFIAGLDAPSLTWSWHTPRLSIAYGGTRTKEEFLGITRDFRIQHFVVLGKHPNLVFNDFLAEYTDVEFEADGATLYIVNKKKVLPVVVFATLDELLKNPNFATGLQGWNPGGAIVPVKDQGSVLVKPGGFLWQSMPVNEKKIYCLEHRFPGGKPMNLSVVINWNDASFELLKSEKITLSIVANKSTVKRYLFPPKGAVKAFYNFLGNPEFPVRVSAVSLISEK